LGAPLQAVREAFVAAPLIVTGKKWREVMAVRLQPSQLLAKHLQIERQAGLLVFKLTAATQERLEDLLTHRKDLALTADEQAELDALAELDRIFTYINSQLALAHGHTPAQ
jgi:hypothetical protein